MVGLFRLGRTLKYKNGPIATRRLALLELLDHVERIGSLALAAYPRWRQLREIVGAAARPFMLDQVEDEIDAIACAHLAWLWHDEPSLAAGLRGRRRRLHRRAAATDTRRYATARRHVVKQEPADVSG